MSREPIRLAIAAACLALSVASVAPAADGDIPTAGSAARAIAGIAESAPGGAPILLPAVLAVTYPGGLDLQGRNVDPRSVEREVDRLARRLRTLLPGAADPAGTVSAMNRLLFDEEGFAYDPSPSDPSLYMPDRVLAQRRGNCLGLTVLYLALAERTGIPVKAAYAPSHVFPRYERGAARINIETAERGVARPDAFYAGAFRIGPGRPYLSTLGTRGFLAVYVKTLGAAYARLDRGDEALALYDAAASLDPGLPDAPFNAGVSLQKAGRADAAIARYRAAIALDPGLAAARNNLAVALARKGFCREALEEARGAAGLDPGNGAARRNLEAALIQCGVVPGAVPSARRAADPVVPWEARTAALPDRPRPASPAAGP